MQVSNKRGTLKRCLEPFYTPEALLRVWLVVDHMSDVLGLNGEREGVVQVMDAAMEAGADDVTPAEGDDGTIEGYKVGVLQHSGLSLSYTAPCRYVYITCTQLASLQMQGVDD